MSRTTSTHAHTGTDTYKQGTVEMRNSLLSWTKEYHWNANFKNKTRAIILYGAVVDVTVVVVSFAGVDASDVATDFFGRPRFLDASWLPVVAVDFAAAFLPWVTLLDGRPRFFFAGALFDADAGAVFTADPAGRPRFLFPCSWRMVTGFDWT